MSTTTTTTLLSPPSTKTKTNDEEPKNDNADAYCYPTLTEPTTLHNIITSDIYLLGSLFTILCQFAHPALAKGSYNHSSFAKRPLNRLINTGRFLNVAVTGTEDEKRAIFSVIHKYHAHVKGEDYSADDPELHKWTAATLFVSILVVKETFFGKMTTQEIEGLFRECAIFGTSLRMPGGMWPDTLEEFWVYWDTNIATLTITDEARYLVKSLLYPPTALPWAMALSLPILRTLTINWLPGRLAREYDLQPGLGSQAAYVGIVSWVRTVYPFVPGYWKGRMARETMEGTRRAVENIGRTGHWGRG